VEACLKWTEKTTCIKSVTIDYTVDLKWFLDPDDVIFIDTQRKSSYTYLYTEELLVRSPFLGPPSPLQVLDASTIFFGFFPVWGGAKVLASTFFATTIFASTIFFSWKINFFGLIVPNFRLRRYFLAPPALPEAPAALWVRLRRTIKEEENPKNHSKNFKKIEKYLHGKYFLLHSNTCEQIFSTCYTHFNLNLAVNKYRRVSCKIHH